MYPSPPHMPSHSPEADPAIGVRGEVVYLYAFDVANEIHLDSVPSIQGSAVSAFVGALDRTVPKSIALTRAVGTEPVTSQDRLNGRPFSLQVRIYEIGVICITVRVAFDSAAPGDLLPFHRPTLGNGLPLDDHVRALCDGARLDMAAALVQPGEASAPEAYTVFSLNHLGGERDAARWCVEHRRSVAGLLTETAPERLSDSQVDEALRLQRGFETTDLAVVDWDAALVIDLDGSAADILLVLELANLQLEEFRWMDRRLDEHLDRAYSDLRKRGWRSFGSSMAVLRSLRQLRLDLARLADEVNHSSKFIGDWHLARVYLLARERFHIDQWRASVEQRLGQLDDLYTLVRGELYDRRMLWLEIIIVLFFAVDILIILLKQQ